MIEAQTTATNIWELYSWRVAVLAGLIGLTIGLFQLAYGLYVRSRENRLSQAKFAYAILDDLFDKRSGELLAVLDGLLTEITARDGARIKVTRDDFAKAITRSTATTPGTAAQRAAIYHCLDTLLYYFERIQQAIDLKLVRFEDVRLPISYYVSLLIPHKLHLSAYIGETRGKETILRFLDNFHEWKRSIGGSLMTPSIPPANTDPDTNLYRLSNAERIQLWQHFVSTGGTDKEKMITITIWLLAFSATLLGYIATAAVDFEKRCLSVPPKAGTAAVLGLLVSVFAWYIVWAYRSHATWNWNKANTYAPAGFGLKNPPPRRTQAGVFRVFRGLIIISFLFHMLVLGWSACTDSPCHVRADRLGMCQVWVRLQPR
jgi:hypothetical protein